MTSADDRASTKMDPISIVAGVLGIAKSISGVRDGIRWIASIRNAPSEFLDLQNEVRTLLSLLLQLPRISGVEIASLCVVSIRRTC